MPDRERKRVPDLRSNVFKGSLLQLPSCPPQEHGISKYPRLCEESKRESRPVEMKQLRAWYRAAVPLARGNVEAEENHFVLNPSADWCSGDCKEVM